MDTELSDSVCTSLENITLFSNSCENVRSENVVGVISKDVGGISHDVGCESENAGGISKDVGGTSDDLGCESENVGGISHDVGCESENAGGISKDVGGTSDDLGCESENAGGIRKDVGGNSKNVRNEKAGVISKDVGGEIENAGGISDDIGGISENAGGKIEDVGGKCENAGGINEDGGGNTENAGGKIEDGGGNTENAGGKCKDVGGESENVGGTSKKVGGRPKRTKFVPHNYAMARILQLLKVDLYSMGKNKVKRLSGYAKVDKKWVDKFISVDWNDAFTDEGHLRLTRVFYMLPKLVPDADLSIVFRYRCLKSSALGLEDYNLRHKDGEYYLVKPTTSRSSLKQHKYVNHANFLAKRKNPPGSPVELFFTEVIYTTGTVLACCLVEPEVYPCGIIPPLDDAKFKHAQVIHPKDFECHTCAQSSCENVGVISKDVGGISDDVGCESEKAGGKCKDAGGESDNGGGKCEDAGETSKKVGGISKKVGGRPKRTKFVPHNYAMARILQLLRVDLYSMGKDKVKHLSCYAKVDKKWVDKFISVDWNDAFTDEGHLRLTRVFYMLPKLVPDADLSIVFRYRCLKSSALGLEDYNLRHKDGEYYLVKAITSRPALKDHKYVNHANFLAKRKNSPGSPVELFFTEVFYTSGTVLACCLVEPEAYPSTIIPPLEDANFKLAQVIHPKDFECHTCARRSKYL